MLTPFALTCGRNRLTSSAVQTSPKDLASGFPRADHSVRVLRNIHAAHRAGVDVPLVKQPPLEAVPLILRSQEVDVPMNRLRGRTVERINVCSAVDEDLHSAAAAGA